MLQCLRLAAFSTGPPARRMPALYPARAHFVPCLDQAGASATATRPLRRALMPIAKNTIATTALTASTER